MLRPVEECLPCAGAFGNLERPCSHASQRSCCDILGLTFPFCGFLHKPRATLRAFARDAVMSPHMNHVVSGGPCANLAQSSAHLPRMLTLQIGNPFPG